LYTGIVINSLCNRSWNRFLRRCKFRRWVPNVYTSAFNVKRISRRL